MAQLVSNVGKVTDGLILKIQSEGLFIDDDVRNIPQREWDVKAWTLKLIEVCSFVYSYLPFVFDSFLTSTSDRPTAFEAPTHPACLRSRCGWQEVRVPH